MMVEHFTAKEILKIPADRPDRLFSNDLVIAKRQFHKLSFKWFPDRNPDIEAATVFIHIKKLYDLARQRIGTPLWASENKLILTIKGGKTIQRAYHIKHDFELGKFYIGDMAVTYIIKPEFRDFYQSGIDMINSLPIKDAKIQAQIGTSLPTIETTFESQEGLVIVIKKTKDILLLRDVLNHLGSMTDKHTAWIFGRLVNLCCYLQFVAKTVHNAFNPDTIFISPAQHSVHLLGGWWYSTPINAAKLLAVPQYTVNYGHPTIMRTKKPDYKNDLTLIKAVARELLGDVNGLNYLKKESTLPKPLVAWLNQTTTGNAIKDYEEWEKVRDTSFGPRKFIELPLTVDDIY